MTIQPFTAFSYAPGFAALGQGIGVLNENAQREKDRALLMSALGTNPQAAALAAAGQPGLAMQLVQKQKEDSASGALNKGFGSLPPLGASAPVPSGGGAAPSGVGAPLRPVSDSSGADTGGEREDVNALKTALGPMESGNRYDIKGPLHKKYGYPLGKYQVMESNLPQWSQAALGRVVSSEEYLRSPELQEKIAGHRMGQIIDKYGNLSDAASVWHSGRPLAVAKAAGARDVNMSTADYVNKTVGRMRGSVPIGGASASIQDDPSVPNNGPGVPLPYRTASTAPVAPPVTAGGEPTDAEVQQMIADGVLPKAMDRGYLKQAYASEPVLRQNINQWRAQKAGGAAPVAAAPPLAAPMATASAPAVAPGMTQAPVTGPADTPAPPPVAEGPQDGRVRLAQAGTSDMPVQLPAGQFLTQRQQQKDGLAAPPTRFVPPAASPDVDAYRTRAQQIRQLIAANPNADGATRQAYMAEAARHDQEYSRLRQEQVQAAKAEHDQQASLYRDQQKELRTRSYTLEDEARKEEAARKRGPASFQEFDAAKERGYTAARTPAEYEREKAEITKKADKSLPAELGARVALSQSFLDEADDLRKKVAAGTVTGLWDAATAASGRGEQGEVLRKIKSGSEAIVRNLTGAGMNESEARARVTQYEPSWRDDAATVLSKFDMLRDQLFRIEAEAYRGRGVPENRKGKNPYFEGAAPRQAPQGAPATAPQPAAQSAPVRQLDRAALEAEARRRGLIQ